MAEPDILQRVAHEGQKLDEAILVEIGPAFLELFSEQMYSTPNKAFEELISNSWDAGARNVYIGLPDKLSDPSSSVWVLDDGVSMDFQGLADLWAVAESKKPTSAPIAGRQPIGKFGIGKLATYILARQLTYVCRAADGVVRAVTMDYDEIRARPGSLTRLQMDPSDPLKLGVRVLNDTQLNSMLAGMGDGGKILDLIGRNVPRPPKAASWEDEFGGEDSPAPKESDTWTLALLTALKPAGVKMQDGQIRRLLRTALPLGSTISIVLNGETLSPSKIDAKVAEEWPIASGLALSLDIEPGEPDSPPAIVEFDDHIELQGVGKVTGRIRLYNDKISEVKSDRIGASNGFFCQH